MKMIAIRGAITVNENSENAILKATKNLLETMENQNNLNKENVVSIIFSVTDDLTKVAPAKAARKLGYTKAGLMCFNEMYVENSLKKCIRVMILYNTDKSQLDIKHVYLEGAKILRPDLL